MKWQSWRKGDIAEFSAITHHDTVMTGDMVRT